MLVLSRKNSESICIDDTIQVSVLEVRGNRFRPGITAPPGVVVRRPESQACLPMTDAVAAPVTSGLCKAK